MPLTRPFLLGAVLGLLACTVPPEPCPTFCEAAGPVQATCLEAAGSSFEDAGWGDEAGFVEACTTWAWSARRLEADARRRGAEGPWTSEACASRLDALDDTDACDHLDDWDLPWE